MSAIRPPVPSPLFPAQGPVPSPARASRSDFFRAALEAAGAPAEPSAPAPAATAPTAALTAVGRPADDRPQRPGALRDIRV